ncbi:xin actin-binding repeat-containing protein 2 isoform X2 [Kryptolebias marmoratus]|uniref:xin actin-binding repeat-containing protein 2 isoform X2 n=1 Tax=Kryptolebias marmoratus TaxID=37003 RepID=UPI000D530E58|nr:xin actin-binding repeat-containing protein 2 isoform X2 [Kryptolebias marmoratus]
MYQAAVSKRADNTIPSGVMEESEVCSLPGGLASVQKQFETQETASTQNVTQFHFHNKTQQEMSTSEVTVSSGSKQVIPGSQQLHFQETMVTCHDNNLASSYENHQNETEDFPRYTTKELRDHFERTIEEAASHKPIKIGRSISQSKWSSNVAQNNTVTGEVHNEFATEAAQGTVTVMDYEDFLPPPAEDSEYLPPPPLDLLQVPSDSENIPVDHYSHEPPEPVNPSKQPFNREAYLKHQSMSELKRLYRHIHPEVRKNIEKEFYTEYNETENNQVDSQGDVYEDDGSSPDEMNEYEEYEEWEDILPGEVQAMRWMFENKPLDAIKDETPDEDEDGNNIIEQEIIVGRDVRRTARMFETKPIDELGSLNPNSTEYKNKFNKFDKGDVRAATWLFETQTMDTLNKMHTEEDLTKEIVFTEEDGNATIYMIDSKFMEGLGHTETIDESHLLSLRSVLEEINGEYKTITSTFDTQFKCVIMGQSSQMLEIKSVRKIETELENSIASRWLFDTQPLEMANSDVTPLKLVCSLSMEDNSKGDWGRWLFEIKTLNSLSEWKGLQMEKKEITGADVRKHCLVFETQPTDSLKDDSNARPQSMEYIIGGNVRSARDFFESSPQAARKNYTEVGKLKKAAINEEVKGDVRHQKWRFESQPLEQIREEKKEVIRTVNVVDDLTQEDGTSCRADVRRNCWVFETQPMDTLKDDSNTRPLTKEEIIAGNVKSARQYFETVPSEDLKELAEVGKLKKDVALNEEKGDVRHQKWRFESQPLEEIREERKEIIRTIDLEEIDKVDVSNYKQIFESTELNTNKEFQTIHIEGITSGSVKSNKNLFESSALYAMQDSSGHFHEVKTVRREEVVKGDVTTYKWMFETRPIDQFDESIEKYQIIKGISKQEVESGDVKTAKWLFETQPLDAIKYFSNIEEEETVGKSTNLDVVKGDVKTCKWLFETKPMDILYERVELRDENESEEIRKGDVKTCTWLFETQALDAIHDETETVLKTRTLNQEEIRGKDVKMACFLFETENLEDLTGEEKESFKRVTEIDIASGDVSRKKYIFENQTSEIMSSTSEEVMQKLKRVQTENIERGNVVNCKWLFENQSIDTIHDSQENDMYSRTVNDIQKGDVGKGRFIFETYSLDKIQEASSETEGMIGQKIVCEEDEKGDVRNYTMMFENQSLYAIQDKEGHYHEVTTVTSEEIKQGDVVGTRWLFETKPLDAIKDTDEVYLIKSVTQQDVQKGDVMSAKWKFETQPLDMIADEKKPLVKTVEDIERGNVRVNKQRFETDTTLEASVRTVNVSEIQKGDVRTAKWKFETQSIDKIRSMSSDNLIETVKKEDVAKGDVKHSVWLFEKTPLDHIKETDEDEHTTVISKEIPKADVKTTTWLFETTPFDDFNETKLEKTEILGKSVMGTLEELYSQKMVKSKGILIEADEIGDVRMAKYQLMNKQAPEIQREEIIRGDLQTIMMNLLNKQENKDRQIVIDSEEKGNISSTVQQLFSQERSSNVEKEEILRGDIQEAINNLFDESGSAKQGILIQEDEKGDVQMTIYSLLHKHENVNVDKEDIVKGDIKRTLERLSSLDRPDQAVKIKVDDMEKGNVQFYSTCIESGALDYLKQLQLDPDETPSDTAKKEEIIGGDIKGTKSILTQNQMQIERTVEDVIPGDVHNTLKVFMSEPTISLERIQKEEIVKGDLRAALNSLSETVNQTVIVEKEEVVKGNIPKALRCLERAQRRYKEVEKPDIIPGNIKGALRSLENSATSRVEVVVEDLVPGDVKATLKSLERAKQKVREVEKEEIVRGDIHTAMQSLQDASSEKKTCQQEIDVQGDVKGAIQIFMEPPPSPRMQRGSSLEGDVKGDIKMSIKSLYETQEQTQLEKEEVVKGNVKGTIKSLLETAQRETPKIRHGTYRRIRVKQGPSVKNLKPDAQRNAQKIKTAKQAETSKETHSITNEAKNVRIKVEKSTVMEHRTITQNHGIKTVKTEFRNLKSNPKGMIKPGKTRVRTDDYMLKTQASESELPLPPPPVVDTDLLPPPPPSPIPPTVDTDTDHLPPPPPPPPLPGDQDFLPPPPSQRELESMPVQPTKAKRMTVKKVKAPALHPVPKLESKVEFSQTHQVQSSTEKRVESGQIQIKTTTEMSKTISREIPPPPPESPQPLRKVYISPVKFTPPPSPPPFIRGKTSKFHTPLIKAEEKYRKLKEESTPPTTPSPTFLHESVSAALEMLSTTEQPNYSSSGVQQEKDEKAAISAHVDSCDLSKQVVISNNTQNEKITADPATKFSIKQTIVTNDTTNVVSMQKTSSVNAVRQHMQTTTQEACSVSLKQSASSSLSGKMETSITDAVKTENIPGQAKKDSQNHKTKSSNKSEDTKENRTPQQAVKPETKTKQVPNIVSRVENIPADKNEKESKSTHGENDKKKTDDSSTKGQKNVYNHPVQTDKVAPNTNEKTGKQNQKMKKTNNKQEKQAEMKMSNESEKQSASQHLKVELKEAAETKQEIKKASPSPPAAATPAGDIDIQPEPPTPAKKKKKSKKSKGGAQQGQSKDILTESKTESTEVTSDITQPTQKSTAVKPIHKSIKDEHVQIKEDVITTDSKDDQNSLQHKVFQVQETGLQKKGVTVTQQRAEEQAKESRDVPITVTVKSEQNEVEKSSTERKKELQRREVQVLISQITEIQSTSEKAHSKSVKSLLNSLPDWLITTERKRELEQNAAQSDAQKNKEILLNVRKLAENKLMHLSGETMEKHECELGSEKSTCGLTGATRISKISIGSSKIETQSQKTTSHESRREEGTLCKSVDFRAPSPSLRMRPPSPTFITIESIRRTDSPQRVTPSPTLLHRPPTPPTPPPRRCDTPTSRITRITPSPTFDKAENLARLKDTTAKLSRVVTPPPLLTSPIPEKKSEIVESPATFHRQIKIDSQVPEASEILTGIQKPKESFFEEVQQNDINGTQDSNVNDILSRSETHVPAAENEPDLTEESHDDELSSASVKEKKEFFEEAQKTEMKKVYMRKEPIMISERLGPELEEWEAENKNKEKDEPLRADVSGLVNKFESPEEKLAVSLRCDTESTDCDEGSANILEQEMPTFNIQAIKNVFELGEQISSFREEKRDQEELVSSLSKTTADTSKRESPLETKGGSRQSTPLPFQKTEAETVPAQPSGFSETKTVTEHFSNVDEFGNKVTGTVTAVAQHSESISTQQTPFSYADVVKRKAAKRTETYDEDATERLLRNFHKTWTESEAVFKNLGYTVSEETTSQLVSHQMETVSSDSSSEVGALYGLPEESLSNGCSDSGQKKVP